MLRLAIDIPILSVNHNLVEHSQSNHERVSARNQRTSDNKINKQHHCKYEYNNQSKIANLGFQIEENG